VSLIGDVAVVNNSQIMRNTNRGPGGGIAVNLGGLTVDSHCCICENTGASLGGGIASFTPNPGQISVSRCSQVSNNILTNAQTIQQTIESFLDVITRHLILESSQAEAGGGPGGQEFVKMLPSIISQLTTISEQLKALPIDLIGQGNLIAGGGIATLLTSEILIDESQIENNLSGQKVTDSNFPLSGFGGGLCGFDSNVSLQRSLIKNNTSLSSGGGVWSGAGLNTSGSRIYKNKITNSGNGGGLFMNDSGQLTIIESQVIENVAAGDGGGLYSTSPFSQYRTEIANNQPNNINHI
jgi:hypothetical protein